VSNLVARLDGLDGLGAADGPFNIPDTLRLKKPIDEVTANEALAALKQLKSLFSKEGRAGWTRTMRQWNGLAMDARIARDRFCGGPALYDWKDADPDAACFMCKPVVVRGLSTILCDEAYEMEQTRLRALTLYDGMNRIQSALETHGLGLFDFVESRVVEVERSGIHKPVSGLGFPVPAVAAAGSAIAAGGAAAWGSLVAGKTLWVVAAIFVSVIGTVNYLAYLKDKSKGMQALKATSAQIDRQQQSVAQHCAADPDSVACKRAQKTMDSLLELIKKQAAGLDMFGNVPWGKIALVGGVVFIAPPLLRILRDVMADK
jgi:hypothetical protein